MKIVVADSQQMHSYQLATALSMHGMLAAYCTTVYYRPRTLTSLVAKFLPSFWKKKATGRRCSEFSDSKVRQFNEAGGLVVLFCYNIKPFKRFYPAMRRRVEDRFAKKVAKLAEQIGADAVVGYDGMSASLFEEVVKRSPETVCVCDMAAVNALYLKTVFERDIELKPEFQDSLFGWVRIWDPVDIDRTKRELAASDSFLCGSSFVARSLAFSGISRERTRIVNYGVDTSAFPYRERKVKNASEPLVFAYLGQVSEHKGVSWLFEAFEGLDTERARLVCIGDIRISESLTSALPSNIELRGMVQHDAVSELLLSADVMLFPSLGDGFPLSVMEGFASGLPVVCSDNTGAADCVVEGENGFVVPTQNAAALREKIDWFLEHREEIPRMAARSRDLVMQHTWDSYYENVARELEDLILAAQGSDERRPSCDN